MGADENMMCFHNEFTRNKNSLISYYTLSSIILVCRSQLQHS